MKKLEKTQQDILLNTLKARFEANMERDKGIEWSKVKAKLEASPEKMWSLNEMERTGGDPDVVGYDEKTNEYIFNDCSKESPTGRRNISYDREAQEEAKKAGNTANGNAVDIAKAMGIEILTREQYMQLQKLESFDWDTWSWIKTSNDIRAAGYALDGFRNYGDVDVDRDHAGNHNPVGAF